MFYEGILQLKMVFLAVELKANCFLEKSRAGNKPGSVLTDVSRAHLSRIAVTGRL